MKGIQMNEAEDVNCGEQDTKEYHDLPLRGVKVVEFCNVAAGPFCGMLLGDMGASVVKIDSGSGDSIRQWPPLTDGFSENFASPNRNKRSIALDLKNLDDRVIARRMIEQADVVIENNRPGVMDRLGLGYESFADTHPLLIYCSMSAYGHSGPRSQGVGFYADERFYRMADRVKNQQLLAEQLTEIFARWSVDHLIQAFEQAGIPCSRINSYSEALADPQVAHMGWVSDIELPGGAMARTFGSPLMIDGDRLPIRLMPPALDADRAAILAEVGQVVSASALNRA